MAELVALDEVDIDLFLEGIRRVYGHDYRNYARASLRRRVRHLQQLCGAPSLAQLQHDVMRDRSLFARFVGLMSINVTEMFRDPHVFLALRERVVPILRTYPFINIWHAGCASGEEVYSLAIILREEGLYDRCRIYATDCNPGVIEQAGERILPADRIPVSTQNYQRAGGRRSFADYYHARYDRAKLADSLLSNVTFAVHNLVCDAAFAEMHLVLCRNVLIYFDRNLQDRVLSLFADCLVRRGFLCLGCKESLQTWNGRDRFEVVDQAARLYRLEEGAIP